MAQVSIKYRCGDKVQTKHSPPTEGIVSAIFIRGRGRSYEIGYASEHGPASVICTEEEIESAEEPGKIGYK